LDGGEERFAVFGVSCGDAPPSFEVQERVFDEVAEFIQIFVVRSLGDAVFLWRDHGIHTLRCGLLKNGVGIVPFVRDQMIGVDPFNQAACLRAIRLGTFCNNDSDRQTLRIHGQMYLGIEPPFVRPMSWFPPLAPAAWGWTLQWLASIISHS